MLETWDNQDPSHSFIHHYAPI